MTVRVWFYPWVPWNRKPKLAKVLQTLGWEFGTKADHHLRIFFSKRTIDKNGLVLDRQGYRKEKTTQIFPKTINGGCTDVSKSYVEEVFREVFGYGSFVGPDGDDTVVQKTEIQAVKDIKHRKTCTPKEGYVVQRFIDTRREGLFVDLRAAIFDGSIETVIVKRKPKLRRASGAHIDFVDPRYLFTRVEIDKIVEFSRRFGLDCGEIDILRDKYSDLIYLIDVNPTTNSDVDYVAVERQLGALARSLTEERYAEAFKRAFWNEKWRVY